MEPIDAVARAQHRGGYKQRKRARELSGQSQDQMQPSKLGSLLMELWAWNQMLATALQTVAHAAKDGGITHPDMLWP